MDTKSPLLAQEAREKWGTQVFNSPRFYFMGFDFWVRQGCDVSVMLDGR